MKKKTKLPKPPSRKVKGIIDRKEEIEKSRSIDYKQKWIEMVEKDKEELRCCGTCKWIDRMYREWCTFHYRAVSNNDIIFGCNRWEKADI